ncbi:methionine synthase II (cobalamin-independent) [Mycobacteroides abscessus subsp. abscessus]|nr:methionine synthase II (cobalamin-independent) [Mycobacteroides abscessus subsp. abscessus]
MAAAAASVTDRLGFPRTVLRERVGLTPSCGLAGATEKWARTALTVLRKAADGIAQDPDAA